MIGLAGIVLALGLLMWLAYRGASVLLVAPAMALLAALFAPGTPLLATYTQVFMPAAGSFIVSYFPLFLLGAVFGRLMDDSGAANAIAAGIVSRLGAERAVLAVVLACAVLTYGGVSLFVVAFAIVPVAAALFRQAMIPKRLIPATVALGAFTFTMTALPGTPAIQNAIPMPYFGTTPFAAPGLGIIAAVIMFGLGQAWLNREVRRARRAGEGFGEGAEDDDDGRQALPYDDRELREHAQGEGYDLLEINPAPAPATASSSWPALPSLWLALSPIVIVIALNYVLSVQVIPALDTGYLAEPRYGETSVASVRGVWAIIVSLTAAIGFIVLTNRARLSQPKRSLGDGANGAVLPIFNTASLVGFGAVVAALPAFEIVRAAVDNLGGGVLVSLAVAVNVLAGLTGSASGGMSIALETLGADYLALATAEGIAPELLHRITTIATGGLDSLPHNGAVVTLLGICGLTHRQAYKDLFVVAVLAPLAALAVVVMVGVTLGAF